MTDMRPMLDCDAVMRQLWDYLDGELTPARMQAIREHLALCQRCYPQLEFEQAFLETIARTGRTYPNMDALRSRIMAALLIAGFAA